MAARLGCLGGCAITRVAGVGGSRSAVYLWGTMGCPEFLFSKMGSVGERIRYVHSPTSLWTDFSNYLKFDLFFNDIFVLGGQVMRQKRGVAIGGMCSAQCASI